ncbi:hypothetical protein Tco_1155576 [Tanacetum coccineum]
MKIQSYLPWRDRTTQISEGKVGVYTRLFDYVAKDSLLPNFLEPVLKFFRINISSFIPLLVLLYILFEVLTAAVLDLGRLGLLFFVRFISRIYSDGRVFPYLSFCIWGAVGERSVTPHLILVKEQYKTCFVSLDVVRYIKQVVVVPALGPEVLLHLRENMLFRDTECGKTLASLRRAIPEGSLLLGSSPVDVHTQVTVRSYVRAQHFTLILSVLVLSLTLSFFASSRVADAPVYTAADTVTSSRGKTLVVPTSDVGGSSQPETSEESADSFYETAVLNSEDAKRWYIPRWNITNDSLLDDGFSCRTLVDRICLGSEVRSRTDHELELKEKLRAKYDARGVLLREKDAEIARLKSLVVKEEGDGVRGEVSALKSAVLRRILTSPFLIRASYLKSASDGLPSCLFLLFIPAIRAFKERWKLKKESTGSGVYQGILGHALGRAVDYGMQEGLAAGHEHGVAGTPLSAVVAYILRLLRAIILTRSPELLIFSSALSSSFPSLYIIDDVNASCRGSETLYPVTLINVTTLSGCSL